MPAGTTTFPLRGTSSIKTTLAIKGIPATAVKIDKDAYSSATFDGALVSATRTGTASAAPPASAASPPASAAFAAAKLPAVVDAGVVVPAPNPGPAEAPPAVGETTP
jgi:hypothetical protein